MVARGPQPEIGTVVRTKGRAMVVRVPEREYCAACNARFACATVGEKYRDMTVPNQIGAKTGDRVEILLRPRLRLASVLLVFLSPVVLAFAGYLLGWRLFGSEKPATLTAMGAFVIGFALAWGVTRVLENRQPSPVLVRKAR